MIYPYIENNEQGIMDIGLEQQSISMEAVLYPLYYRQHGIRRIFQLTNPVVSDLVNVSLPKGSIYHYNPESPLLFGPTENNVWYKDDGRIKFIKHIAEWQHKDIIGTCVRKPGNSQTFVQAYRRKHRSLKLLRDFFGINRQENMLIVYNYCLLNQLYRYRPHRLVNYYYFYNLYSTIIESINKIGGQSERQQFFEIRLPKTLPTRTLMNQLAKESLRGINTRYLKFFPDADAMLLHHLWMWVGKDRQQSIFNKIQEMNLSKVNLIIKDEGRYTVLNLGELNKWRNASMDYDDTAEVDDLDDTSSTDDEVNNSGEAPERLQVRFYKMLTTIMGMRTGVGLAPVDVPTYTENEMAQAATISESDDDDDESVIGKNLSDKNPSDIPNVDEPQQTDTPQTTSKRMPLPALPDDADDDISTFDEYQDIEDDVGDLTLPEYQEDTLDSDTQVVYDENPEDDITDEDDVVDDADVKYPEHVQPLVDDAKRMLEEGQITARQYQRVLQAAQAYLTIPSPYNPTRTIAEELEINVDETDAASDIIPDNDWVIDKAMLSSTTEATQRKYINEMLNKDIIRSVMSLQKAGVLVTGMERTTVSDPSGTYDVLEIKVQPINGVATTIKLKMPVFDESGTMTSGGVVYHLRSQRRDVPIRKVNPTKVSLTSYYGKLSVIKSDKKVSNLEKFLHNQIQSMSFDGKILDLGYGNVLERIEKLPAYYSMIATRYKHFTILKEHQKIECLFESKTRYQLYAKYISGSEEVRTAEAKKRVIENEQKVGGVLFGYDSSSGVSYFLNSNDNMVYASNTELPPVDLISFLGIDAEPPAELAEIKIFSKSIPVGILLGFYMGITPLCNLLEVKPRKFFRGQRLGLTRNDYAIRFADEVWVFDKRDYKAQLILNGFNAYKRYLQDYSVQQFERSDVYMAILRDAGISLQIENELNLLKRLFIDDITRTLLMQMKEPTEWEPLLIRSVELLTDMRSRPEINMQDMIIAGHQRVAGQVYSAIVKNVKANMNKRTSAKERFDLPPNVVFEAIRNDPATAIVDDINPIQNLKEHENVTFGGDGGRSTRTMVADTRAYDESDMGTISEATVDSSMVGVTTYLSANPGLTSVYGRSKRKENLSSANILSTSSLLSVGVTQDDGKRTNFVNIQNSHSIGIAGAMPSPVMTGYEYVIAHRVDKKFAWVAKHDGVVVELSKSHIGIKYTDSGKVERVQIGTFYGVSTGKVIKNPLVTDYKLGQEVKAGDVVVYNTKFFVRDIFQKSQVLFKYATLAKTAFMESNDTEEDGSAISQRLNAPLTTETVKVRTLVIPFTTNVHNLVKVGTKVENDTVLCTLVDAIFSDNNMFGEDDLDALKELAQSTPRAKYPGTVQHIEVMYYGDPETADVSESVKTIIEESNKERQRLARVMKDGRPETGQLFETLRIEGNPTPLNNIIVKIYIHYQDGASIGDKFVVKSNFR